MPKADSIFTKVLISNLTVTLIPLILVVSVICFLFCSDYRNNTIRSTRKALKEYVDEVNSELASCVRTTDSIMEYNYIIDGLNVSYQSRIDLLLFLQDLASYMDNVTGRLHPDSITIYFSNPTLYESNYLLKTDRLEKAEAILTYFRENSTNIFWEDALLADEDGRLYFQFYRRMALNQGAILSCKAYIPEAPHGLNVSLFRQEDFSEQEKCIFEPLSNACVAVAPVDYAAIHRMYLYYVLLFSCLGLCFLFALIWLAWKITRRITMDTNSFILQLASAPPDRDMATQAHPKEPLELRVIKNSIQSLMDRVQEVSASHYSAELARKKLELNLLQSKINPHVLYNSLSVIKLKVFKYADQELLDTIDHLVDYYHAVLGKGKNYVTISEEIDLIKNFVYINEISHGKSYHLETLIPEELADQEILHLLLQPFVENAIVHGLSGSRQDCRIRIACARLGGMLEFTIYDNGYGLSPGMLNRLNHLSFETEAYGIRNVYQRLTLEYGAGSTIRYDSRQNVYTWVTIRF